MQSHADIATTLPSRAPGIAATSVRGGVRALRMKLRQRPRAASERESVHRIVASPGNILRAEPGAAGAAIISLEPTPLASASIGQVHRARLTDGTRVAVKRTSDRKVAEALRRRLESSGAVVEVRASERP